VPLLGVARWSVTLPSPGLSPPWLSQYRALLTDPLTRSVVERTLRVCGVVTVAAVLCGYGICYVWVRGSAAQRALAELCILVPFWISLLIRAFGWVALLSSRGVINTWLEAIGLISDPLPLVRNEFGVVVGMTHFLIPFAAFPLATAMRQVDERVLMAARGLGASRARVFWTVFLPMTRTGVIGAAMIVFVFALGFFVTPAILGGGRSVMIAELVYLRIFQSPDWGFAAALSVALVVLVGALMALLFRLVRPADLVR
jgi:putative spermidine/putrescine transport system permease protein